MEKRSVYSTVIICSVAALFSMTAVFCDKTDSRLEKGSINLELGDYVRARSYFEATVDERPTSAAARLGLGKALLQQFSAQPHDSALIIDCLMQLEAARTLQPEGEAEKLLSIVWFKRANGLLTAGDTIAALRALSRSTSLDPSSTAPVNLAGILYFHRGETDKALNLFRKVMALDTASVSGYFNAGMVLWSDSNCTAAYDCFFKAAQRSPGDREILMWAARAKQRIGRIAP
jgi:tetratricopeptide (TPR) repeat protein